MDQDYRELRSGGAAARGEVDRRDRRDSTPPMRLVGRVFEGPGYSAAFPRFYATHPVVPYPTGEPAEGAAPIVVDTSVQVNVAVFDRAPVAGDLLVASLLDDGHWVADRIGGHHTGPGPCTTFVVAVQSPVSVGGSTPCLYSYAPAPGISVTYRLSDGSTSSCTTGADGTCSYSTPSSGHPTPSSVTVTDGTCSFTGGFFSTGPDGICTLLINYCKFKITAAITPEAAPTISVSVPSACNGNAGGVFVPTGIYTTSPAVINVCQFQLVQEYPPYNVGLRAYSTAGNYIPMCAVVEAICGGEYEVDLTQFNLDPCYLPYGPEPYSTSYAFDLGCGGPIEGGPGSFAGYGKGPNYRGAFPKNLQVRFSTAYAGQSNGTTYSGLQLTRGNVFADDEGEWIDVIWTPILNELGAVSGWYWDSGLRGGGGNYATNLNCVESASCYLNYSGPYDVTVPYHSTRATVTIDPDGTPRVSYFRYPTPDGGIPKPCKYLTTYDCSTVTGSPFGPCCVDVTSGYLCETSTTTGLLPSYYGLLGGGGGAPLYYALCAPVDFTVEVFDYFTGLTALWLCEVRESPC